MTAVSINYNVHIPALIKTFRHSEIGAEPHYYFNDHDNDLYINQIGTDQILPFLDIIEYLCLKSKGNLKVAVTISGVSVELFQLYCPEVIHRLKRLAQLNCIEFCATTYSNIILHGVSIATIKEQVNKHLLLIGNLFHQVPVFFRENHNSVDGHTLDVLGRYGWAGIALASEAREANHFPASTSVYKLKDCLILREDDSNMDHINELLEKGGSTCAETVAFDLATQLDDDKMYSFNINHNLSALQHWNFSQQFWESLAESISGNPHDHFTAPSDIKAMNGETNYPLISRRQINSIWHDSWNDLQKEAYKTVLQLSYQVANSLDPEIQRTWLLIQDAENLGFMSSDYFEEEYAQSHFTPYSSPYDAFTNYMNVLDDVAKRLEYS